MQSYLLMLHVLVAVALVALVLVQHGRGADAGAAFGSGASGSVFGSRGPTSFLTRMTTILATVFFLTSLTLAWLASQSVDRGSVVDRVRPATTETTTDEVAARVRRKSTRRPRRERTGGCRMHHRHPRHQTSKPGDRTARSYV